MVVAKYRLTEDTIKGSFTQRFKFNSSLGFSMGSSDSMPFISEVISHAKIAKKEQTDMVHSMYQSVFFKDVPLHGSWSVSHNTKILKTIHY